jgi:pteridine reductase
MSDAARSARVALVTGGAVRVGRAIVEELALNGWRVAFTYRSSHAEAVVLGAELARQGATVAALSADLDRGDDRRALLEAVLNRFGRLDALVNNAAIFPRTPLEEVDEDSLRAVLRTNLEAPVLLSIACAPHLRATRGSVVNIADIHGLHPLRHHLPYSVSKAALIAATRALASELAPEARANAIAPGIAVFPDAYDEAKRCRLLDRTLLKREGGPAEIASAVHFLLDETSTMTGQVLVIDGGRTVAL